MVERAGFDWAGFVVARRAAIDRVLAARVGAAFPAATAPEAEALRRFRSFACARLGRGDVGAPALDGLRVDAGATTRLVEEWCRAAAEVAGAAGGDLAARLAPLAAAFGAALLSTEQAHDARRAPRVSRRAVPGAIDRIADAYLAVDLDDGSIADANPAAATLLRVARAELVGKPAAQFVASEAHERWSAELDALAESAAPRRFTIRFVDARGAAVGAEVQATRHATRDRALAVLLARPC